MNAIECPACGAADGLYAQASGTTSYKVVQSDLSLTRVVLVEHDFLSEIDYIICTECGHEFSFPEDLDFDLG